MKKLKNKLLRRLKGTTDYTNEEKIILRDFLALERTKLANERTYLSYIKFALYLIIAAIALLKVENFESIKYLAYVAITISIISLIVGTFRFFHLKKQLKSFYKTEEADRILEKK